jgi:hypothetical protein
MGWPPAPHLWYETRGSCRDCSWPAGKQACAAKQTPVVRADVHYQGSMPSVPVWVPARHQTLPYFGHGTGTSTGRRVRTNIETSSAQPLCEGAQRIWRIVPVGAYAARPLGWHLTFHRMGLPLASVAFVSQQASKPLQHSKLWTGELACTAAP